MHPSQKRRQVRIKHLYGVSLEDYNKMFLKQKGKCKLCFRPPNVFKRPLFIDHCHETNKIRGLLCGDCNRLLTYYRDVDYFKRVVEYLDNIEQKPYN